ncbi:MAG: ATP--guanido phosphotransferase [Clostridia bacterium]|nr:ATP--guanido phosphotransferase [Clostridia bacterium]
MSSIDNTVISTRVRLARNIEGYPFPGHFADEKQAREVIRHVASSMSKYSNDFNLYYMNSISDAKAQSLVENHLISPNLLKTRRISAALISADECVSIMINEEDHLREQCIMMGLNLNEAYDRMSDCDSALSGDMKFAYDEQLGYLTACPTNVGTGLRASVMLFLPALSLCGLMQSVSRSASRLGLTVRGSYGEGSEAEGYTYQISNEVTLGLSEGDILSQVHDIVMQVCDMENAQRRKLAKGDNALELKDQCMRAYGILTNCARLTSGELQKYSAYVKLGAVLGFIPIRDVSGIDGLVIRMRPSNITDAAERDLTATERDVYRAEQTGKFLKGLVS